MSFYDKVMSAYALEIDYAQLFNQDKLVQLLKKNAEAASCTINMFFLPLITAVCGLMGISTAKTHRANINFEEPNIIWSCVAAEPGARKSPAMRLIIKSLEELEQDLAQSQASETQMSDCDEADGGNQLFIANESVTMAKLHSLLKNNNGVYLNILDEIESLFKTLDGTAGPDSKDRRVWLSLHTGTSWCRSTKAGRSNVSLTRMNYTGYMQPDLLIDRLCKRDTDGFMDRHWCCFVKRRRVLFEDIGDTTYEENELTLSKLFATIFEFHNSEANIYKLDESAGSIFASYFNEMENKIEELDARGSAGYSIKKQIAGMLNKSSGQALRMAMALQALFNAADNVNERLIQVPAMKASVSLTEYFNRHKVTIMGQQEKQSISTSLGNFGEFDQAEDVFLELHGSLVKKLLKSDEAQISSSKVVQLKRCPPGPNGYSSETAKSFLTKVADCGFGVLLPGKTKKSVVIKLNRAAKLSPTAEQFLKNNGISLPGTS